MIATVVAGLFLGAAGSAHCAGMCGPLVLLAGRRRRLHQIGRLGMYVTLGIAAGLSGSTVAGTQYRPLVSALAGVALLFAASGVRAMLPPTATPARGSWLVRAMMRVLHWRQQHGIAGALVFGAFNGLLPCGLIYAALTAAAGLGDPIAAAAFMAAFWAGSLPTLVAVAWSGAAVHRRLPAPLKLAVPLAVAAVGVLLIARGLWPLHDHDVPDYSPTHVTAR